MTELRNEHLEALDAAIGFLGFSENDLVRKLKELRSLLERGEPVGWRMRHLLDGKPISQWLYVEKNPSSWEAGMELEWDPLYLHPEPSREREALEVVHGFVLLAQAGSMPHPEVVERIGIAVRAILGKEATDGE